MCIFVNTHECKKLRCIVDERICGDTFLRVEKFSDLEYIVSDIWMYNSNCVFACSNFKQRYDWLHTLLQKFTKCIEGVTIDLIHKYDLADDCDVRGYEVYTEEIGKFGYFVDKTEEVKEKEVSELEFEIMKMSIPDCYELSNGKGYLLVPDLKTSVYLRSKGERFTCRCVPYDGEFWQVAENIPNDKVNAS